MHYTTYWEYTIACRTDTGTDVCEANVFYPEKHSVRCDLPVGLICIRVRRRWIAHCGLLLESPPPIRSDTVCPQRRTPAHRTEQEHCTATLDDIFLPFQINYNHLKMIWVITTNAKLLNRNKLTNKYRPCKQEISVQLQSLPWITLDSLLNSDAVWASNWTRMESHQWESRGRGRDVYTSNYEPLWRQFLSGVGCSGAGGSRAGVNCAWEAEGNASL